MMLYLRSSVQILLGVLLVLVGIFAPPATVVAFVPSEKFHSSTCYLEEVTNHRFPPHKTETSVQFTGQLQSAFNKLTHGDPGERLVSISRCINHFTGWYIRFSKLLLASVESTDLIFPFHFFP